MSSAILAALITALEHKKVISYANVASIALLAYDYLLTFDLEVSFVWNTPWGVVTGLYYITRYLPFIDIAVVLYQQFKPDLSPTACLRANETFSWFFTSGLAIAEIILTLRTWAICGKGVPLSIILILLYIGLWVPAFINMNAFLKTIVFGSLPIPLHIPSVGCILLKGSSRLFINWVLIMCYDACMCALLAMRAWSIFRSGGKSRLLVIVYRDGIIYYIYLFGLSLLNVILIFKLPADYLPLLSSPVRVIHALLTARVVLHAREQAQIQLRFPLGSEESATYASEIRFQDNRQQQKTVGT
ncbi:hypothetical protein AMATHDRAFT_57535 [Amanita thiersii Skay4041]|uniref:DUF6533 domain-containing protein n=1 Tax=Amanita thiersii Skay4041 TaxID=703135 RepID=A0A2A9NWN1_9AGAR|nr:hypothetical protein AMATHDRAFT_57535 [Amanita thiersii Skay4041]